jgi:hypothetical protein
MKVSTRSLMRDFPKAKAAARKGQAVEIVDGKTGERFVLTAKATRTFGEIAARAKGRGGAPGPASPHQSRLSPLRPSDVPVGDAGEGV